VKRVLVVDENPISQKITAGLIRSAGFAAGTAESGEQALLQLADASPDLVVTSLRLPVMDGLAFTRAIKSRQPGKPIPVILLTAAYSIEEEIEAVKAGCECALEKPLDPTLFPGLIALYLGATATLMEQTEPFPLLPMKELRDEFLSTSAAECRRLLEGFGDHTDYTAIQKALHRWAGVGGTLGFPAITTTARELEPLAENPRRNRVEDLGLGLSELMEMFTTAQPVDAAMASSGGAAARTVPAKSKAPRILICDDDPLVRGAIQHALESAGYRCRASGDGATIFNVARADPPDAIVLDINMPRMDGFRVLYALKNVWNTRSVPVLMLTASHEEADMRRSALLGASDYMTKPFDPDALVGRIDRLLMK